MSSNYTFSDNEYFLKTFVFFEMYIKKGILTSSFFKVTDALGGSVRGSVIDSLR